ncbi:MAG: phosphoribosylformylglycinamidine cyclo-ligase [Halobacteria archaeon]
MDYSDAGVDIEASDSAVDALADELQVDHGDYAGLIQIDDRVFGLTTDGVGTKILVAEALDDYSSIGIDCIAMNVNDLIAMNLKPAAFVDYLVVEKPDEELSREIGEGLAEGADQAGTRMLGGETAVMPEVVEGVDLAGTCLGYAYPDDVVDGTDVVKGDLIVGFPSSGIHSNGLTLARKAVRRNYGYSDEAPYDSRSIGEELLEPTRIYTSALGVAEKYEVHGMAHITGGGYTNLSRISPHRYVVDDPLPIQPVFDFIKDQGNVDEREMYRTFNMGMGFVAVMPEEDAYDAVEETDAEAVGFVEEGDGVNVRGMEI